MVRIDVDGTWGFLPLVGRQIYYPPYFYNSSGALAARPVAHGAADVHGVAAEAVELGNDEDVLRLQPIEQTRKPAALGSGNTTGDGLGDNAARLDSEAGGLDLLELVVGRLAGVESRRYANLRSMCYTCSISISCPLRWKVVSRTGCGRMPGNERCRTALGVPEFPRVIVGNCLHRRRSAFLHPMLRRAPASRITRRLQIRGSELEA